MHRIPWHLHTIQKSDLLKTWESQFSVWVIEFTIISTCFGKGKVFSKNSNLTNLVNLTSNLEI